MSDNWDIDFAWDAEVIESEEHENKPIQQTRRRKTELYERTGKKKTKSK